MSRSDRTGHAAVAAALARPVDSLPGIARRRSALLAKAGIERVGDLLFHFPRDYQDRRRIITIEAALRDIPEGELCTVQGEIESSRTVRLRRRLSMAEVVLCDESGRIKAIWFGRDYLARTFKPGTTWLLSGPITRRRGTTLSNPEYEPLSGDEEDRLNTGRIVPIYRLSEGLTQRLLRRMVVTALDALHEPLPDDLPAELLARHNLPPAGDAIRTVHFPDSLDAARRARGRFAYEELLAIQIGVLGARAARLHEERGIQHQVDGPLLSRLRDSLPFELTQPQQRAVGDILGDMAAPRPMLRLLQGDVGCGKTVVALHAIAAAADSGRQTAVMAPTEILAEQHWITLRSLLEPLGLDVELLTGSTPGARAVRGRISRGDARIVVGTHALIQETTTFHDLGLAVIDEQHRFGVIQRGTLTAKGLHPDILHMTATPIPRTLAITVYGGMDLTVIDELPPGRNPIRTRRITPAKVPWLYEFIRKQAAKGHQTYYVCPLIEESESRDLTAVTTHCQELAAGPFSDLKVGLLHGRLPPREKEAIMERFKQGKIDVLFTTTVIEVGVDCPNATVMAIEDAGQFGLTQLHQLRGRTGRGPDQAHCFLIGTPKTKDGMTRVRVMCDTSSGFDIAEEDLTLRGPGEFHGVRQAGLSDLRVADLIRDVRLLDAARRDAQAIVERDPHLEDPSHAPLRRIAHRFRAVEA